MLDKKIGIGKIVIVMAIITASYSTNLFASKNEPNSIKKSPKYYGSNQITVWAVSGLERIRQNDSAGTQKYIFLQAARRESEPFQIVVKAPKGGLTNVNVIPAKLTGENGNVISAACFELYLEKYIKVTHSTSNYYVPLENPPEVLGDGYFPDALVPFKSAAGINSKAVPFSVAAQKNQPVWVDMNVPENTPSGKYQGTFVVTSDQGKVNIAVEVMVWNFELPKTPALRSAIEVTIQSLGDKPNRKPYYELLLKNRLMPNFVSSEYAPDYMDRLGLNATNIDFWPNVEKVDDGNGNGNYIMNPAPEVAEIKKEVALFPENFPLYSKIADEIDELAPIYDTVKSWSRNMHEAGVRCLSVVPPKPELMDDGTGRSVADIWVIHPLQFDYINPAMPNYREDYQKAFDLAVQRGNELWSYTAMTADGFSPNFGIDFDPINCRIVPGFLNQRMNLTGLLYWNINILPDPWTNVTREQEGCYYPGDGQLTYPGETAGIAGPVPSIRLKWLREGVDDFDYIALLKQMGAYDDEMQALVKSVAQDWHVWTKDHQALYEVRAKLGQRLHELANTK